MLVEFPESFPMQAVSEAVRIIRGKTISQERVLLARCAVTLECWALGKALGGQTTLFASPFTDAPNEDELALRLAAIAEMPADAHAGINPFVIWQIAQAIKQLIDLLRAK